MSRQHANREAIGCVANMLERARDKRERERGRARAVCFGASVSFAAPVSSRNATLESDVLVELNQAVRCFDMLYL